MTTLDNLFAAQQRLCTTLTHRIYDPQTPVRTKISQKNFYRKQIARYPHLPSSGS
jgi:hypothetical protein